MAAIPEDDIVLTAGTGEHVDQPSDYVPPVTGRFRVAASKLKALITTKPRFIIDAIRWSRGQITEPSQSWKGLCQSHCRTAYGLPAWAPSAIEAWRKTPKQYRHPGKPEDAPRGALLYYEIGKYGHVAIATGIKTNDKCLSNDYMRQGRIDYTPRRFPRWGVKYLGWSDWTPYGRIAVGKPVK